VANANADSMIKIDKIDENTKHRINKVEKGVIDLVHEQIQA
jgi:hypothetical protein